MDCDEDAVLVGVDVPDVADLSLPFFINPNILKPLLDGAFAFVVEVALLFVVFVVEPSMLFDEELFEPGFCREELEIEVEMLLEVVTYSIESKANPPGVDKLTTGPTELN